MSKIGKKPITIPENVSVTMGDDGILVKGEKGQLLVPGLRDITVDIKDGEITFSPKRNTKQARSNWGTMRALVQNAIQGITEGFSKTLLLEGVGYRITKEGEDLNMNLGFSHSVRYNTPKGITFEVEKNTTLIIRGIDKTLVGQVAAKIRAFRKPEPYKGTGFRYADEIVRRKAGKKAATAGEAGAK